MGIEHWALGIEHRGQRLRRFLPGPYCFILQATREVPKLVQSKRKTVGIRIPNHEVIRAITRELGRPVISTTAQRTGEDPHVDAREIDSEFHGLGMVVDAGGGGIVPTTVIDLTKIPPLVDDVEAGLLEKPGYRFRVADRIGEPRDLLIGGDADDQGVEAAEVHAFDQAGLGLRIQGGRAGLRHGLAGLCCG